MNLSMITVCFNAENCIEKTMQSVLKQTYPVYEYIIVDGKSKDNTMNIVKSYEDKFAEANVVFRYISEPDRGISDAFNKGIKMATGDIIGLINADDEMVENTNEILQKQYESNKADIYYGNCIWIEDKNSLSFVSKPKETNPSKLNRLLYEMVVIHPATFISKNAYDSVGTYDISFRYCMDQELLYKMNASKLKFCYIDQVLSVFKAGGVSDRNAKKVFAEASRIAINAGEPKLKVKLIELKKNLRNSTARFLKKVGFYKILKRKVSV